MYEHPPRNDTNRGWKWQACDRCGFDWPKDMLQEQDGVDVCKNCYDEEEE